MKEDEDGGVSSTQGREKKCLRNFDWETWREQTIWNMGGQY